jgi:hypothetical protein
MYEVLDKCGIPRSHLYIEADLAKYVPKNRSEPIALTLHGDANRGLEPRIVFREVFNSAEANSVRSRIGIFDLDIHDRAKKIDTDEKLVIHILLHEIEHYKGLTQESEDEANGNAIRRMEEWGLI